jgi:hypothetical protein
MLHSSAIETLPSVSIIDFKTVMRRFASTTTVIPRAAVGGVFHRGALK